MREIRFRKSYEKEGFKQPVFEYRPDWPYISIGFGNERDYFIENLSLLIASGMGISSSLGALSLSVKSWKMKKIIKVIESMVNAGAPLWKSFEATKLLPERVISLVRSGEEAGKLADHLNLVTIQQHKEKIFHSRLRSALIYPGIVLSLAFIVALGSAWILLPKLISAFVQSNVTLPWATKILMVIATFFEHYGAIVVPAIIAILILVIYGLFFYRKTKFIGDFILFHIPGIKGLLQGIELARFGYIFGVLLQAGFQVGEALESIKKGTTYDFYRKFYVYLQESINQGQSFREAFACFPRVERYVPIPIQQLIFSAEKSGKLSEIFIRIGIIFEEKTDAMSRDLAIVLEPIVLIIVGFIVSFIVMAITAPIYGLSSQIQ